jgi:outer membrane protein assembly factor BamD (BamD/ComL family)
MRFSSQKTFFFAFVCALPLMSLELEELTWEPQGPSAQEYNGYLQQATNDKDWWAVVDYANILSYHFATSPFAQDAAFLIGEAYLNLGHPLMANDYFTAYLNNPNAPRRFEEAIAYKFSIAERFQNGEKKQLFNSHKAPKILSAKEDAIVIYDEVIATLPHSELAAKSLLGKAKIQAELEDYKQSLETLDLLIRRFPKHELAAEAYLEKIHVYNMQCQGRSLDPDLLDLAEVTLRKFRLVFPRESRLSEAESYIHKMEEAFAANLLDTGTFFQKTKKTPAAKIYYSKVIAKYPKTPAAIVAQEKLNDLRAKDTAQ